MVETFNGYTIRISKGLMEKLKGIPKEDTFQCMLGNEETLNDIFGGFLLTNFLGLMFTLIPCKDVPKNELWLDIYHHPVELSDKCNGITYHQERMKLLIGDEPYKDFIDDAYYEDFINSIKFN